MPVDVAFDVAYQGDVYLGCGTAKKVSEGKRTDGRLVEYAHQRVQRWYMSHSVGLRGSSSRRTRKDEQVGGRLQIDFGSSSSGKLEN